MDKDGRQKRTLELLKSKRIGNQGELVRELQKRDIECTQASVSRDLAEMGVIKVDGVYKAPGLAPGQSALVDRLTVDKAGDNLVVIRTGPSLAQMAALRIDQARIAGLVGTVAGDDTIFLAVRSREDQNPVIKKVLALFKD